MFKKYSFYRTHITGLLGTACLVVPVGAHAQQALGTTQTQDIIVTARKR